VHAFKAGVWHKAGNGNALRITPRREVRRNVRQELASVAGVSHAPQHRLTPAFEGPAWKQRPSQRGATRQVRILVPSQVNALAAGTLEQVQHIASAAPDGWPHTLDVRDLHANARTPSNLDGLVEGHEQPDIMAALIAHVRGVELAACRRDCGQV